jgi:hypothetical protein
MFNSDFGAALGRLQATPEVLQLVFLSRQRRLRPRVAGHQLVQHLLLSSAQRLPQLSEGLPHKLFLSIEIVLKAGNDPLKTFSCASGIESFFLRLWQQRFQFPYSLAHSVGVGLRLVVTVKYHSIFRKRLLRADLRFIGGYHSEMNKSSERANVMRSTHFELRMHFSRLVAEILFTLHAVMSCGMRLAADFAHQFAPVGSHV